MLIALGRSYGLYVPPAFFMSTGVGRILESVCFHYLRLPVPSMLFFGLTLLAVALCIPRGC